MRDRLVIQLLVSAVGVAVLGLLSYVVISKVGAPVFLPGAIGLTVILRVLGQRWERRKAAAAARAATDV